MVTYTYLVRGSVQKLLMDGRTDVRRESEFYSQPFHSHIRGRHYLL